MAKADEILNQLKDIHMPAPVGLWPLAPGWYITGVLFLIIAGALTRFLYKKHRHGLAKNHALKQLKVYAIEYAKHDNAPWASARVSELLRQVALVYYPRAEVASLYNEAWIAFLDNTGKHVDFNTIKGMLLDTPFKTNESIDLQPLFQQAECWIKQRTVVCSN